MLNYGHVPGHIKFYDPFVSLGTLGDLRCKRHLFLGAAVNKVFFKKAFLKEVLMSYSVVNKYSFWIQDAYLEVSKRQPAAAHTDLSVAGGQLS